MNADELVKQDKVLIMFEHKYNQEKYDQSGADSKATIFRHSAIQE